MHLIKIKIMKRILHSLVFFLLSMGMLHAGNPDRQGEAGATELLLNPWAKSAGVHSMSTSYVTGVEAMRVNVAGMSRIDKGEISVSHARLYDGSDLGISSLGLVSKMGNGAFGVSFTSMDFGDIPITTTDQPAGTGGTFSPSFFNLALGYSYTFVGEDEDDGKISVGALFRGISETLPDVGTFGFGIDAGVQYISGERDNFKLGVSLRNVGSPMEFGGEGLSFQTANPDSEGNYPLTVNHRAENFEIPSVLDIGVSYDFYLSEGMFIRTLGNFTSNAFSQDQIGAGAEFFINDMIALRAAYKHDLGEPENQPNLYTGFAGGVSIDVPLKRAENRVVGIDYAYRTTDPFRGTHNFSLRFGF